jgi:hypothetical protein
LRGMPKWKFATVSRTRAAARFCGAIVPEFTT